MSHKMQCAIYWFRNDLRLKDNPAFIEALHHGKVLPVFILDEDQEIGAASSLWLHHSLRALQKDLGEALNFYKGKPKNIFEDLLVRFEVNGVYWNRAYTPYEIKRDISIKNYFQAKGIDVQSFNGSLLFEPWEVKKSDGEPYKVFTSFFKKGCLTKVPRKPLPRVSGTYILDKKTLPLEALALLPKRDWGKPILREWNMGEKGAYEQFEQFLFEGLSNYKEGRNHPAQAFVSKMSPYLHFGEVSPNQLWYKVQGLGGDENKTHYLSELCWREFSYSLLYYNPSLPLKNLQKKFDRFPWIKNKEHLIAWQRGQTGVPFVDAGMRELWQTGYMHNRVRMVVASFLVKNLSIDWREGAAWFFDCLIDADLANNSASWQWVAGSGADAAPYFRIFNPVTQGQKFDSDGDYIRRFVPELAKLPNKYLFAPWEAPIGVLEYAQVELGLDYPKPLVDLKKSRARALSSYDSIK